MGIACPDGSTLLLLRVALLAKKALRPIVLPVHTLNPC